MRRIVLAAPALAFLLAACGNEDAEEAQKVSLATASGGGYTVELLADEPLQVGLNALYLKVTDGAGASVTDAGVEFRPLMTMSTMSHRCPVIGPSAAGADGLYALHAVFQMASGMDGSWSAEVVVSRGGTESVAFPVLTVVPGKALARTFLSGVTKYVMSMELTEGARVGLNPVVVTLHEATEMGMSFAPVNDAVLVLDPQMPSMGHGSPGSVDPVLVRDGWYEGQLSFSMTGEWETTITASREGVEIGAPVFTVDF